jgi:hypothetical protein
MRSPVEKKFRELWGREGSDRMTRAEIAKHFGKSLYWVQWMFVKTGVEPRNLSPAVKERYETGEDGRLEYMAAMQRKSALVVVTNKMLSRMTALRATPPHYREFIRRLSDAKRTIATAERHIETVTKDDPNWPRMAYMVLALEYAKESLIQSESKLGESI